MLILDLDHLTSRLLLRRRKLSCPLRRKRMRRQQQQLLLNYPSAASLRQLRRRYLLRSTANFMGVGKIRLLFLFFPSQSTFLFALDLFFKRFLYLTALRHLFPFQAFLIHLVDIFSVDYKLSQNV
jgi:hypothetical protein